MVVIGDASAVMEYDGRTEEHELLVMLWDMVEEHQSC